VLADARRKHLVEHIHQEPEADEGQEDHREVNPHPDVSVPAEGIGISGLVVGQVELGEGLLEIGQLLL